MSSVSDFQSLDLCVAYYCVAVTPLHLCVCVCVINLLNSFQMFINNYNIFPLFSVILGYCGKSKIEDSSKLAIVQS